MRPSTVLLVVTLLGTFGCGRVREVRGCRALARVVNPAFDEIAARTAKDRSPASYRFAADRYRKLAADLKPFDIGIPRTEGAVDELGSAMKEAGAQATKLAEALERGDSVVASSARRELAQLARQQKSIAARIDDDCTGN